MPIPIANIAQLGLGLYQGIGGLQGLNNLSQYPDFTEAPEIRNAYNRAEGMTGYGYTPAERSAFMQNLAGQSEQRYKRGVDIAGGSLAGAIQSGINYGNTRGLLNFASDDAALHRRNIAYADSIARQIQGQANLITQGKQSRYNKVENAYGNMLTKGLENIVNPLNLTQSLNYMKGLTNNQTNDFKYLDAADSNYDPLTDTSKNPLYNTYGNNTSQYPISLNPNRPNSVTGWRDYMNDNRMFLQPYGGYLNDFSYYDLYQNGLIPRAK